MGSSLPRASGAAAVLATVLALGAPGAEAGPPLRGLAGPRTGVLVSLRPGNAPAMGLARHPSPYPTIDSTGRLQRIQLDAEASLRAQRRDRARDAAATVLRASGDAVAVEQARTAWRTEERLDAVQGRVDWDEVLRPGSVTRRILEQSRIRLREQQRQRAVDTRADALRPPPPAPPTLGSLPATRLEPPSR